MRTDRVAILVKKTALVIEKNANHILAPFDLTNTQYKIMKFLYANQDVPVRQADIEEKFSMTNPTVTGIIQNLEKKRLITRAENPEDRRSKLLVLTEQAMGMKDALDRAGETIEGQATANLTAEERDELARLLKKVLEHNICDKPTAGKEDV